MPLATRVIPVVLCRGRTMVKGTKFNAWRSVGLAAQAVRTHASRGVDEVCLLDIGATPEGRPPDFNLVRELSETLFVPLGVGGGIRTVDEVRRLLAAGCDKVLIGAASRKTSIVRQVANKFGKQAVVSIVDYDSTVQRVRIVGWCLEQQYWGAGEILLQSIERDGLMTGYDLETIRAVSAALDIPVIACGGCSGPEDMLDAIHVGASAVAAGALFAFSDHTPKSCAEYLAAHNVETRIPA